MTKQEATTVVVAWLTMLEGEGSLPPRMREAVPLFREWLHDADLNIRVLRRITDVMMEETGGATIGKE